MKEKNNYKVGALKRKLGVAGDFKPGELIAKMNEKMSEKKVEQTNINKLPHKTKVAIMGLI